MKNIMKLYWAETNDHDEDWFIVATSAREARRIHEDSEGYDRGDAEVTLVCRLPESEQSHHAGWPRDGLLKACGGKQMAFVPAKERAKLRQLMGVVEEAWTFNGKTYFPGDIVENTFQKQNKNAKN